MVARKVALVTGGGSGIGRATGLLLGRRGAAVLVADIDPDSAESVAAEIVAAGGIAYALACDAADEAAIAAAVAEAVARFGGLDLAVNNIGGGETGKSIVTTAKAAWDDILARNLTAPWLAMKYEIPAMEARGGGSIVNVSSIAGVSPQTLASPAYAAAKAGLLHLTRYGARTHAEQNIRINAVAPGLTRTPLVTRHLRDEDVPRAIGDGQFIKRLCEPEEIAATIVFLLSDEAAMITGHTVPVSGGVP